MTEYSTVPELIRAADRPGRVAIRRLDGAPDLTYADFDRATSGVAAGLARHGVRPGDVVATLLPRSVDYVVAAFGILRAGAACLPLNPRDPWPRVSRVLAQNAARALVAQPGADLPYDGLVLDAALGSHEPAPVVPGHPNGLAFVFATSGSTGTPKSVRLSHRACASQLGWVRDTFTLTEADTHLFKTSPNFVSVLRHLVWPLATGGSVVVLPDGAEADFRRLAHTLAESEVTVATFIPSSLRPVLEHLRGRDLSALRHVICGGELLDADLQRAVFELSPRVRLHSVYAMTEAPLIAHWECDRAEPAVAPIGRPVPGIEIAIDKGVLSVRGAIFDGYSGNDPRFPDGWFVTGDVVQVREPGGPLYYAGRADAMVKIRGFRIEPSEIEARLLGHPDVRGAIVEPRERDGGADLVAYVASAHPAARLVPELRAFTGSALPEYMVPAHWRIVPEFPLLENGKVDRQALRRADRPDPVVAVAEDDGGPLTGQIREIWEQVLGMQPVGLDEEFSSLGGDSLRAIQIVLQVEALVGRELPFEIFVSSGTVRTLARACTANLAGDGPGG